MNVPSIRVACAIVERDGLVLAARRKAGLSQAGKWEFPGGKIESGETVEACLLRELLEELGLSVSVLSALPAAKHRYPAFEITLHPFVCSAGERESFLKDHDEVRWDRPENLAGLAWAEADVPVLESYLEFRRERKLEGARP